MSRQLRIASLIWGASILLSRLIGLVREGVIGRTLGAEARGDLYATAFTIPDFLNDLLAGGALGPFLMPLIAALRGGLRWRATFAPRHPDLKRYFVRSLPIMLGFSIVVVDDWYLKREGTLIGSGAAASLSYAKSLMK